MRSLLGTRGKTQARVYHSIKEEGERLRGLCQNSAVCRPFHPLFLHPHSAHAFSLMSPRPGHSRSDRPTPSGLRSVPRVKRLRRAAVILQSDSLTKPREKGGRRWPHTLTWVEDSSQNWGKASSCFLVRCADFFLNWLNWQRRSCSLSSGSGANKSFPYFL